MLVWNDHQRSVLCRFGIVGDFLPAAGLAPPFGGSWAEQADIVAPLFRDLRFGIVNLECPVDVGEIPPRVKASLGDTFSAPAAALEYLAMLRANIVALANNHLYDYGSEGAARTLRCVQMNFADSGFGSTLQEPPRICVREITAGVRVGVWAAASNLPDGASRNAIGTEPATLERAQQALARMNAREAHCRVAFLHAGSEGTNYPDPADVEFMRELAAMGFDVIAACHSHRISGYETVRGKAGRPAHSLYGLGSLSSGVLYSPLEHEGILGVIALDEIGEICEVEARPIYLDEHGWGTVPTAEQKAVILDRFQRVSASIRDDSYRHAFYRDVSRDMMGAQWRDTRLAFQRAGFRGLLRKLARMRPAHVRRLYHKSLSTIGLG